MVWLALHFPALCLEVHTRGSAAPVSLAVVERHGRRVEVLACSPAAAEKGIRPGQSASAAQALAHDLVVRPRNAAAEQAALEGLALWAGRFTPGVSLEPPDGLLLEIGSCLRLHRGLDRLLEKLRHGLAALGYRHALAHAPTPSAAWLLARATPPASVRTADDLAAILAPLSIGLLDLPQDTRDSLEHIGIETLGDCMRLPRAGTARRFGQVLLDRIDRALGRLPEARAFHVAPPRFSRRLDLPAPVEHAEALLFAARRLLPELESYLVRHQAGVQHLALDCHHESHPATRIALGFVKPQRASGHIESVLRDTLGRTALPAPVDAIALEAERLLPLVTPNGDLFAQGADDDAGSLLLERLRARLGAEAVFGLSAAPDHRPERAWRRCEAGQAIAASRPLKRPLWLLPRPLWLLPRPQRCTDGDLVLDEGPERIESGWWDGRPIDRDYYVARDRHGARLWVFCERSSGQWFVHGLFA